MSRWTENCEVAAGLIARLDLDRLAFLPGPKELQQALIECFELIGTGKDEDLPQCGHQLCEYLSTLSFTRNTLNEFGFKLPELNAQVVFWRLIVAFLIEAEGAPTYNLKDFVNGHNTEERNDAVVTQLRLMCHHEEKDHVKREHRAISENSPGDAARPRSFRA